MHCKRASTKSSPAGGARKRRRENDATQRHAWRTKAAVTRRVPPWVFALRQRREAVPLALRVPSNLLFCGDRWLRLDACRFSPCPSFALRSQLFQLFFGQVLNSDIDVEGLADADQLVKLDLYRGPVPVLGVLNEKNHQEGNNGRAGIDDELPSVGVAEVGASESPDHDECDGRNEGAGMPGG